MSLPRLMPILLTVAVAGCGGSKAVENATTQTAPPAPAKAARAQVPLVPAGAGALAAMAPLRGMTLRNRPNGRVVAHLGPTTSWGSPTVVWAVERRGPWLGVVATSLANNQIGWIDVRHDRPRMWRSNVSLRADLSQRSLELVRGSKVIRRMTVAIGSPSTPTPTGRFTVTDKLVPDRSVPYYGCCLLALSGHQPNLPPRCGGRAPVPRPS